MRSMGTMVAVILGGLLLAGGPALAGESYWGNATGNFSAPGSWESGGVPATGVELHQRDEQGGDIVQDGRPGVGERVVGRDHDLDRLARLRPHPQRAAQVEDPAHLRRQGPALQVAVHELQAVVVPVVARAVAGQLVRPFGENRTEDLPEPGAAVGYAGLLDRDKGCGRCVERETRHGGSRAAR